MPFSPGGIYSLVQSYFASPGSAIRTEQHNPVLEDIAAALSQAVLRDGRAPMIAALNMNGFAINNVATGNAPNSVATLAQSTPIGAVSDFAGLVAPSGWMLCSGQALSRSTYAALFAVIGTYYGAGDGSTTFNIPDARGCVTAGYDAMNGPAAGRLAGSFAARTGSQTVVLEQGNLPAVGIGVSVSGTVSGGVTSNVNNVAFGGATYFAQGGGAPVPQITGVASLFSSGSMSGSMFGATAPLGSSAGHPNVQPTLIMSKIIRVSYDG